MKDEPIVFLVTSCKEAESELRDLVESLGRPIEVYPSPGVLLSALDADPSGCVVLDVRSPWKPADEASAEDSQLWQIRLPVVFVTGPQRFAAAERSNVVEMPDGSDPLAGLVNAVESAIAEDLRGRSECERGAVIATRIRSLTRREREVMAMVVDGLSNRRIAERFGISARTVEIHRARVMEKMDADSLSELVRMACLRGVQVGAPQSGEGAPVYRVASNESRQRKA